MVIQQVLEVNHDGNNLAEGQPKITASQGSQSELAALSVIESDSELNENKPERASVHKPNYTHYPDLYRNDTSHTSPAQQVTGNSFAHKLSGQNLQTKAVMLKFNDRRSSKKVLVKVKGKALQGSQPQTSVSSSRGFGPLELSTINNSMCQLP